MGVLRIRPYYNGSMLGPMIFGNLPLTPLSRSSHEHGYSYGWLSKVWSPFGSFEYQVPYHTKDLKGDYNFDNHPHKPLEPEEGEPRQPNQAYADY